MDNINNVLSNSVVLLSLLMEVYNSGGITKEDLCKHANLKIKFLRDNLDKINLKKEKNITEQILQKYDSIMKYEHSHFYNIQL